MQTRIPIAEYIKRHWSKGKIELLIVDEIHEYKGGATGQGNALAQMASMSKKILGLTGTLLNGYASSLFYILYRLNPYMMKKDLDLIMMNQSNSLNNLEHLKRYLNLKMPMRV